MSKVSCASCGQCDGAHAAGCWFANTNEGAKGAVLAVSVSGSAGTQEIGVKVLAVSVNDSAGK